MQLDQDNFQYKRFIIALVLGTILVGSSFMIGVGGVSERFYDNNDVSTAIEEMNTNQDQTDSCQKCPDTDTLLVSEEINNQYGLGWLEEEITERERTYRERTESLPDQLDWRDKDGVDWTTPIRNQGGCGSCVAFSAIGAFETHLRIAANDPNWDIDLSEQLLFSCGGGECDYGWYISSALNYLRDYGTTTESNFPYQASDDDCPDSSGWPKYTIDSWNWVVSDVATIQTYLQDGPVVVAMDVYTDFFSYSGGIYEHTSGGYEGGHAITIVGYDDTEGYWIVKNSWGTWWGENGWFRIAYGECDIEDNVAAMTVSYSISEYAIQFESTENNGGTSNQGTITFDSSPYSLPNELNQTSGNYQVTFNPSDNYSFVEWEINGGISVENVRAQSTTVTISASATLTAIYKLKISISEIDSDIVNSLEGNVTFVYPDYQGSKPSGVGYAMVTDWTAAGYVAGMCTNIQNEATDTNQLVIDNNNGAVLLQNKTVILFGGPIVNAPVKYYENNRVAPLYYQSFGGANYWYEFDGTRLEATRMTYAEIIAGQDMFVVEAFTDDNGNKILIVYGYGWKGTFAGGKFFKFIIDPNKINYDNSYYIFRWNDDNGDAFVDLNEISTISIATG